MDQNRQLVYNHPKVPDAFVRIHRDRTSITVECRWPLDLDFDEWFNYEQQVAADIFNAALLDLDRTRSVDITEYGGPQLTISLTEVGEVSLEMAHGQGALRSALGLPHIFTRAQLRALADEPNLLR